ncbi:hypothetical protein ACQUFY_20775 [Robbsia andropogonis]|uniref:hypothetical protein n=1 Tax=Robbsia andropogonis TaxID=28092 RepID=UPI003D2001CC
MGFVAGESATQQPRGVVKLNGAAIVGWTRFTVDSNAFSYADEFTVQFVAQGLPIGRGADWFSEQTDMYVECFAGFPDNVDSYSASDLQSLIYGQVDDIDYDPESGVVEVRGRDLTRVFIDTKTTEKWPNLTASQIATQLAKKHSLTPVVTATTTKAGKFYQIDYVNLTDERTEWDILCYLAQSENFRVYVKGQSLYFEPNPDVSTSDTSKAWPITWVAPEAEGAPAASNVMRPRFRRTLTVSRGIQVVVRSWNAKQGKAFTATYPASKATTLKPGQSSTSSQVYRPPARPGMTQEQAIKLAKTTYDQIIKHEMRLSFEAPADNDLDITNRVTVTGTGTAFDQTYFPESIQRTMSVEGGYAMSVSAKNSSPESQTTA